MTDTGHSANRETGKATESRRMGFDCCGFRMDDAMARCDCGSVFRKHPVVMSAILAIMALAALAIPTGFILGIIAFFRTI